MTMIASFIALIILILFLAIKMLRNAQHSTRRYYPYPPGPKPSWIPFVGNALQIPGSGQWRKFREWSRRYGDVVRIKVLGQQMIILDSFDAANELLHVRGNIYSDRPRSIMAGELVGWDRGLGYAQGPPSPRFKSLRRLFNQYMGPAVYRIHEGQLNRSVTPAILQVQERSTVRLLHDLLESPDDFARVTLECASHLFLLTIYGWDASSSAHRASTENQGDLVEIVNVAMEGFAKASEPGAFWVDDLPMLRHLPSWFPFATFHNIAKEMRNDLERLYWVPWNFVLKEMENGTALPSFIASHLSSRQNFNDRYEPQHKENPDDELIRAAAASIYSGGAETTPSSIQSFILAMLLYPDVQKRAQAELDALLGDPESENTTRHLPCNSDRQALPYISAVVKEVWRWGCAVPLGLAHVVTQDDVYQGMRIDKGTVVWANIWSMLNDPKHFPSPEVFDPTRYLEKEGEKLRLKELEKEEDPSEIAFGFGRRICPGLHLAEHSVFLAVASILYVFDILPLAPCDIPDIAAVAKPEWEGFISFPKPFRCKIVPRCEAQRAMVGRLMRESSV